MREVYRKSGASVRYEHERVITVFESGEAVEEDGFFSCHPVPGARLEPPSLGTAVEDIRAAVPHPLYIERLVVSAGRAEHEFGDKRWIEEARRVHISIVHTQLRVLIDLAAFDIDAIRGVAGAFAHCREERDCHGLRLAPAVSAALLPNLVGVSPPNITLQQSAGGVDGKGEPIEEGSSGWYRPSYRTRPFRTPLNIRATSDVTEIDDRLPLAIALLAPPAGFSVRVLCVDGERVFPATFHIARMDAIAPAATWYPYGAGSFGSEMTVF